MRSYLDFEKPIAELDARIERLAEADEATRTAELPRLQARLDRALHQVYRRLGPWQTVHVARHPERPTPPDYLHGLTRSFVPLVGDRLLRDHSRLAGGLGRLGGYSAVVLATPGGETLGASDFRRVERLIRLADRLSLPVVAFVAVPAPDSADVARSTAVAECIAAAWDLQAPLVSVILAETVGSEGHVFMIADRLLMLQYAVAYPVIPEDAAGILWRDGEQAKAAAESLRPTAGELAQLGLIDGVVAEPPGGAHRDPAAAIAAVGGAVEGAIAELIDLPGRDLRRRRRERMQARATAEGTGATGD